MRETLFRGNRKDNGKWAYGYLYIRNGGQYEISFYSFYSKYFDSERFTYDVIPETVGQYIGLTDKNGKKIFEGDILKNIESDEIIYICYSGCSFRYSYNNSIYGYGVDDIEEGILTDEFEVIGNIHDNPELLLNYNK